MGFLLLGGSENHETIERGGRLASGDEVCQVGQRTTV